MQGCYYVTPDGDGVDVTVAYAARENSLPDNIQDARTIDQILWSRLPFPIEHVVQYPNAFAPGEAATDKIVASRPEMAAWFGARPAALEVSHHVPLTTPLKVQRFAYPAGVLAMVLAAILTTAEVVNRRSQRLAQPALMPLPSSRDLGFRVAALASGAGRSSGAGPATGAGSGVRCRSGRSARCGCWVGSCPASTSRSAIDSTNGVGPQT